MAWRLVAVGLLAAKSANSFASLAILDRHARPDGFFPCCGQRGLVTVSTPRRAGAIRLAFSNDKGSHDEVGSRGSNSFLRKLFPGITLPFHVLRRIVLLKGRRSEQQTTSSHTDLRVDIGARKGLLALLIYLALGAAAYHRLEEEWTVVDALYFSCVTFSTVGFGDLCPSNTISKIFTCVFGLSGIAFLGAAIAAISGRLIEAEKVAVKKANQGSIKRVMNLFEGMPDVLKNFRTTLTQNQSSELLKKANAARKELQEKFQENPRFRVREKQSLLSAIQKTVVRSLPFLALIFGGGFIMDYLNADYWKWEDSIYFSVVTASTIGYGDYIPKTRAAKLFAVAFIPVAVAAAGELLSGIAFAIIQRRQRELYEKRLERDLTIEHLEAMDTDGDGRVTREEYVKFMLIQMGKVGESELDELHQQFRRLDVTQSGYLDNEDLELMAKLRGANVKNKKK